VRRPKCAAPLRRRPQFVNRAVEGRARLRGLVAERTRPVAPPVVVRVRRSRARTKVGDPTLPRRNLALQCTNRAVVDRDPLVQNAARGALERLESATFAQE
jgi:hypothetical protein